MILDLFLFFFYKIWLYSKRPKDQKEIEESYVNGLHKTENWINRAIHSISAPLIVAKITKSGRTGKGHDVPITQ